MNFGGIFEVKDAYKLDKARKNCGQVGNKYWRVLWETLEPIYPDGKMAIYGEKREIITFVTDRCSDTK